MDVPLPTPVNRSDEYMAAVCQRLDVTNELLGRLLNRTPTAVELTVGGEPGEIAVREPLMATPPSAGEPAPVAVTRPPKPKPAAKKATPAKAVTAVVTTPARPAGKKGTSNG